MYMGSARSVPMLCAASQHTPLGQVAAHHQQVQGPRREPGVPECCTMYSLSWDVLV